MTTSRRTVHRTASAIVLVASLIALAAAPSAQATTTTEWFKPGVPHSYSFADPNVLAFGPMNWAYATNTGGADLPAMWSTDATTYTARVEAEGSAAYRDDAYGYDNDAFPGVTWGIVNDSCDASQSGCDPREMWAPTVAFIGTRWVSFHAVRVTRAGGSLPYGRFCIFAGTSSSPMGPFTQASANPIVCPSPTTDPAGAVDPDVFVDEETGKAYLLWTSQGNANGNLQKIWSRQLNSVGTGFASGSTARQLIVNNAGSWEGTTIENPTMFATNGAYVLLYSGNQWSSTNYATGYAVCSGPSGPCNRPSSSPLMRSATGNWGPGGADGLVDQRGRVLAMYHAWNSSNPAAGRRTPHTAELTVTGTGLNARVSVLRRDIAGGAGGDSLWSYGPSFSVARTALSVGGTYTPAVGDFEGDGYDDIYWYGTWSATDARWKGGASGAFSSVAASQAGSFVPVPGDFDGNGRGDLFWYSPGVDPKVADSSQSGGNYEPNAEPDQLWLGRADGGFDRTDLGVTSASIPLPGDFDGDGDTDIIWFQPGDGPDVLWRFSGGRPVSSSLRIVGNYRPIVGDFDGNGSDDLFWYGPGAKADYIWWFDAGATYRSVPTKVTKKDYRPFAGDFDADGADELFWYTPGAGPDYLWAAITETGAPTDGPRPSAGGTAIPVVGDFDGDRYDDIVWYS